MKSKPLPEDSDMARLEEDTVAIILTRKTTLTQIFMQVRVWVTMYIGFKLPDTGQHIHMCIGSLDSAGRVYDANWFLVLDFALGYNTNREI
jgi:hypothetical protein